MITSIAYQKNPDPILWAVRSDGTLLSMTYEREQNVVAWARHPFTSSGSAVANTYAYPTLQELTPEEIPTTPTAPADIALVSAVSITDAAGLAAMTPGNHYTIDADIDLTGVSWTPLNFLSDQSIVIEGNNHVISNMNISAADTTAKGFLSTIAGHASTEIRNLIFRDCTVTARTSVGIVCAVVAATASDVRFKNITCEDCTVALVGSASPTGIYSDEAGIVCGEVLSDSSWFVDCTVTDCQITSVVRTTRYVGGFVGSFAAESTISNCRVSGGTITLETKAVQWCGGFCGQISDSASVYDCTTSMDIAWSGAAGLAPYSSLGPMGGFVGTAANSTLVTCSTTGNIEIGPASDQTGSTGYGMAEVGGFVGAITSGPTITNCYSTGSIVVGSLAIVAIDELGGFAGKINPASSFTALRCWTSSGLTITADTVRLGVGKLGLIGGFVGRIHPAGYEPIDVDVERCWAEGDVTITASIVKGDWPGAVGGFAGMMQADATHTTDVVNCYAWGSITIVGDYDNRLMLGGFGHVAVEYGDEWTYEGEGAGETTLTNCYCAQTDTAAGSGYTNQIPSAADSHGLGAVRFITPTITHSFYDTETGLSDSDYGVGHNTRWMQTQSNYEAAGWDFDTIWYIPDGTSTAVGFNSVAVIPSSAEDEVWLVVSRVVNGDAVCYLEQMQPRSVDDQQDMWFVDSGLSLDVADEDGVVSGLDHLEGEEVCALVDGAVVPRQTVASGSINVGQPILAKAIVGLPFRYTLKPMRFDLTVDGTTKGTLKRFAEVVLSFYRSSNVEYGVDTSTLFNIDWRGEETYGTPPALYTGDKVVAHEGGFGVEDDFIITGDDPLPCTVRAIVPRIEVTGR